MNKDKKHHIYIQVIAALPEYLIIISKEKMIILPLLVVVFLWYLVICWRWKKNIFDPIEKIPGVKWYPIVGTTYIFAGVNRKDVFQKLGELIANYRPFFRTWYGTTPEIHVIKPEHLQVVMRSSAHINKGQFYDIIYEWLGNGLFTSKGPIWFLQRKLLTPAFHFKILESFMPIFVEKSKLLIEDFDARIGESSFNVLPLITRRALDIVCETSMGLPANAITNNLEEYVQNLYDMTELAMWRYFRPYLNWSPLFQCLPQGRQYRKYLSVLHGFSKRVIDLKKQLPPKNAPVEAITEDCADGIGKKKRLSFMDLILDATENKNMMTDDDLRALVDTFIFAGFETTTNSTCWSLFLLGNHPDIQEKVYEEIKSVLKDKPTPTTLDELNKLHYLECVMKEALRLYPVLALVTRRLSEDIELDGYKVPAGVHAILHIAQVHRDPEQFPEPEKFDPDRFLPENVKKRHPFSFIPFSAGPRNCIGQKFAIQEEKTLLASIIKNYKITSMETPAQKKLFIHIVVRPQDGINIKVERRNNE